jgi:putative mRNA 3-end processing factor
MFPHRGFTYMFHFDRGLKLTDIDLAIDFRRRQPRGFISHAHADHMAPHELAFCTPATGKLYQHRQGKNRTVREMPFGKVLEWNDFQLSTHPAGHVFGSAMLLAEHAGRRLLYSGDFKLGPSATAEICVPPRADILVMESTWGDPRYRLPPREQVIEQLLQRVDDAFQKNRTPVIHAYVLGKSQEVTKILTTAGIPVLQHPSIYEVSRIFQECGCNLGTFQRYPGAPLPGHAVIAPPRMQKGYHLANLGRPVSISVTGWAVDERMRQRWNSDHVVPLSDHADFDQLLEFIELVDPEVVHCTHGPASFVEHVKATGRRACVLGQAEQLTLF